jgi:hypothetical protein
VTRIRLREAYSPERLAELYATPHEHTKWADHRARVAVTVQIARALAGDIETAADLSCGDAAILRHLQMAADVTPGAPKLDIHLGDFAPGYPYRGPIEETIGQIPDVDLYVCSETIEHLDDPDLVLKAIRPKTECLVLSTPVECWQDRNPEHYWAWDRAGVEEMLHDAGFTVAVYAGLDLRPGGGEYEFGIWGCR